MSTPPKPMTCMKCGSPVRTYERNGITIDQCTACHGIFLDRGELERLISAESSFLGGVEGGESRPQGEHGGAQRQRPSRGFLGELFD